MASDNPMSVAHDAGSKTHWNRCTQILKTEDNRRAEHSQVYSDIAVIARKAGHVP